MFYGSQNIAKLTHFCKGLQIDSSMKNNTFNENFLDLDPIHYNEIKFRIKREKLKNDRF